MTLVRGDYSVCICVWYVCILISACFHSFPPSLATPLPPDFNISSTTTPSLPPGSLIRIPPSPVGWFWPRRGGECDEKGWCHPRHMTCAVGPAGVQQVQSSAHVVTRTHAHITRHLPMSRLRRMAKLRIGKKCRSRGRNAKERGNERG
jgi:hypothetical protein